MKTYLENFYPEWVMADDDSCQWAKQLSDTSFCLIESGLVNPKNDTYNVYADVVELSDYLGSNQAELLPILEAFGYTEIDDLEEYYKDGAMQIMAECIFEHFNVHKAEVLFKGTEPECRQYIGGFVKDGWGGFLMARIGILHDHEKIGNETQKEIIAGMKRYLTMRPGLSLSDVYCKQEVWEGFDAWYKVGKKDAEYLKRPLIDGSKFVIGDEMVKVTSPSTCHAHERRYRPIEWPLPLYIKVQRMAKAKAVKIGYTNHFRKQIVEGWERYETACAEIDALFEEIIKQAKAIEARGLHYGCVDDMELGKLQELCNKRRKFFYSDRVVSKIDNAVRYLLQYERMLSKPGGGLDYICL